MRQPPELHLPRWTAPLPPPEMTDDIIIVIPTLDVYVGPKTIAELAEAGATTPAAKASKRQHGAGRHSSPAWPPPGGRSSSSSSLTKPELARSQTSIVLSVSNNASATGAPSKRGGLSAWDTSDSPRASFRARAATSDSPRASFRASAHPARTSPKKQGSNRAVGKPSGVRRRSTGAKRDGGAEPQPSAAAAVDPYVRCAMLLDVLMRHRAPRAPPPASIAPSAAWATLDISDGWVSFDQVLIQLNSAALRELVVCPPEQVRAPPGASDAPVYTEAMLRDVLATYDHGLDFDYRRLRPQVAWSHSGSSEQVAWSHSGSSEAAAEAGGVLAAASMAAGPAAAGLEGGGSGALLRPDLQFHSSVGEALAAPSIVARQYYRPFDGLGRRDAKLLMPTRTSNEVAAAFGWPHAASEPRTLPTIGIGSQGSVTAPSPLSAARAPARAVYGWYSEQLPKLLRDGLTRMLRHRTPLERTPLERAAEAAALASGGLERGTHAGRWRPVGKGSGAVVGICMPGEEERGTHAGRGGGRVASSFSSSLGSSLNSGSLSSSFHSSSDLAGGEVSVCYDEEHGLLLPSHESDAAEAAAAMSAERNVDSGSKQLPSRPYDTFVWVDVHRAMADGIIFWESRIEGQLLCDGVEGDGVLPPEYISLVIECNGGLVLNWVMIRLLEQLFRHCARLELTLVHQCQPQAASAPATAAVASTAASSATATTTAASVAALAPLFFVRAASFDAQGAPYEPVLAMLGEAGVLLSETERIRSLGITIGMDSAIKVARGPLFAAVDGRRLDGSTATTAETLRRAGGRGSCGGAVLSVTNACWALPEYHTQLLERAELLSSFQSMLKACSALQLPAPQHSRQHPSNSFNAGGQGAGGGRTANGQSGALGGRPGSLHGNSALASADAITSGNPATGAGLHASGIRGRDGARTPFPPATPEGLEAVLHELWGAGGPLNNLAMGGPRRADVASTSIGGLLDVEAHRLAGLLAGIFPPPPPPLSSISSAEPPEWPQMPEALRACLMQLASETGATGSCETDNHIRIRADGHVQCPAHYDTASTSSFAFVAEADEIGEIACSPFVELLQLLHRLQQPEATRLPTPAATPRMSGQLQRAIYTGGAPAGIMSPEGTPRRAHAARRVGSATAVSPRVLANSLASSSLLLSRPVPPRSPQSFGGFGGVAPDAHAAVATAAPAPASAMATAAAAAAAAAAATAAPQAASDAAYIAAAARATLLSLGDDDDDDELLAFGSAFGRSSPAVLAPPTPASRTLRTPPPPPPPPPLLPALTHESSPQTSLLGRSSPSLLGRSPRSRSSPSPSSRSSSPRQLLSPRNLRAANATPRQRPCTIGSSSGDSGISSQARGEKLSPRTEGDTRAHDSTGSRVSPTSWLHGWRPLEVLQHGSLCSSAILADVRGMVWLLDFSAADLPATSPMLDAASLVCELLIECQPVPFDLAELRGASAHELCERLQLSEAAAVRLSVHLRECESIGALHAGCANDDELRGILPRIADEKGSLRRFQEATDVVDALLAGSPATVEESKQPSTEDKSAHARADHGGMQVDASPAAARRRIANACGINGPVSTAGGSSSTTPQLWKLGHRSPPAEWAAHAQHCFKLCITVLSLATELTAKSSQAEALAAELARGSSLPEPPPGTHYESSATCNPSDLHIANLLFPMLGGALRRLLMPTLGKWQKRLAWHMARSIAQMLHTALPTPPTIPPEFGTVRRQEVRLAAGQRVAVLGDPESRLAGFEGATKLCSVVAQVGEREEGGGSVSLDPQPTRTGSIRASAPSVTPSMVLPEAQPALTKPQTARPLFGDTSVEHRLTFDGLSHVALPWHAPPADAIEAVLADTHLSYGVLQELAGLVTMIPPADGPIADEAKGGGAMQRASKRMSKGSLGGNDESDDDDERSDGRRGGKSGGKSGGESGGWTGPATHAKIHETSDAISRELTRLQHASEPLRLPILSLMERVRKAKADAADARTQATLAEGMATAAKEEAMAAIERAEQRRASAKVAEKQAAADEEKAVTARSECDVAEAKTRELTAAVTKAAEMGAKLGIGTPKRGGGFNMTAMKADEAAKAAQAAREKVSAAQMAAEQTVQMAHAICEVATSAEQAAAKATAAKERAIAHAAAAHSAASIGVIHAALIVAVTVDRRELERVVEAWAWQRLRQTGAAAVRAYAAGQRLMVRIEPPARAGGVSMLKASEAGTDVKAATAAAKKGERHVAAPPRTNTGCSDFVAGSGDTWVDATVVAALEARTGEHVVLTADGNELSLVLNPWNHGPLDLPTIRFDHVRTRHARTMRVQHATLVDVLSGRRLDVLEQCVPIEIIKEEAGTTLFRDRQRAAAATTTSTTAPAASFSAALEAGSWASAAGRPSRPQATSQGASAAQAIAGASEQAGNSGLWGLLRAATASGVRGVPSDYSDDVESVVDVTSLAAWLQAAHATRCRAANSRRPACVLLTAGPYEGKTCLLSQLVTGMIRDEQCALVPILVRSHELEAKLSQPRSRSLFAHSWNWVDAFLQSEYGAGSDIYRFLRQAMLARRALLLIDGIDEGGTARAAIERHIVDVLAPQGHTMVVTSRPAGLRVDLFAEHFVRLRLAPLSDSQQLEVIQRRMSGKQAVGGVAGSGGVAGGAASSADAAAGSAVLVRSYLRDKVPIDLEIGERVSGNPLMLSVVLSIFQSRQAFSQAKRDGMAKRGGVGNVRASDGGGVGSGGEGGADGGAEADELIEAMPTTVALYDLATRCMLEREGLIIARDSHVATTSGVSGVSARGLGVSDGSATTAAATASCAEQVDRLQGSVTKTGNEAALAQLGALLQATFFEAHAMQRRVIDETVMDEAALGLVRPNVLHAIRADMAPFEGRAEPGHYVEVLAGPCVGKRGVVSARPFRVRFVDGTSSEELRESDFRSSGLDEQSGRAFEARQRQQRRSAVRAACEQLPPVTREALREMRVRVTQDRLPLLKLLQLEPLQMQSSHLSFQEYYTACALCLGRRLPTSAAAPWRWDAWWRNTLLLGAEMGEAFGRGLLMAVSESAELLDLNSKIAGDRPTSLLAISQLLRGCASVTLAHNTLVPHEALPLAEGLRASTSLLRLSLASNHLCGVWFDNGRFEGEYSPMGIGALADALVANGSLTTLDLSQNCLGVSYINGVRAASIEGISLVAQAASASRSLRELNVSYNGIGPQGGKAIGDAFGGSATLTALDIGGNIIGLKGGKAVAEALRTNAAFVFVDVRFNSLDEATKALLIEVADERARRCARAESGIEGKAAIKVLLD